MTEFQSALLAWYRANRRDLPWRRTRDPYAIWVSEVMLQQTTVAAVIPYYEKWMRAFPDVDSLAGATEDEIHQFWQGLGYYRRARMLHEGAKSACKAMPTTHSEWRQIPGVGDYTAAAIASIALEEAVPLVDGNVERVFARIADFALSGSPLRKAAWAWAAENLVHDAPGDWNQALMELGATVCRKARPLCESCPVNAYCLARLHGTVNARPVVKPKPAPVVVRFAVLVAYAEGRYGVRRVPPGDWWEGLWEFPRVSALDGFASPEWVHVGTVKTVVTKHRVTLEIYRVDDPGQVEWKSEEEVDRLALSSPMRKVWAVVRQDRGTIQPRSNASSMNM